MASEGREGGASRDRALRILACLSIRQIVAVKSSWKSLTVGQCKAIRSGYFHMLAGAGRKVVPIR